MPALIVIGIGLEPLRIIVLSQVLLSFTLPFALIPLLILTARPSVMARFRNRVTTQVLGWLIAAIVLTLNGVLLWQTIAGS
jgi:manganese transport protein